MMFEVCANESTERAFSSYVKACLQHAQKDYYEELRRDSIYVVPLDAVTFEIMDKPCNSTWPVPVFTRFYTFVFR
ncbi:hypothetical protein DFP94_102430 [Fontibacillus phaseoli]|uniref:Uncharacterized protein n=1 Tax=Fontibacillus phaseoli TaxID=1416533 RepID=A0A369BKM0_9BACL|nr:hypothetical protein DFP94_102430 [Fontibacillus phaseoli]